MNSIKIIQGDCIETLKQLNEQSVNTCITSPPYWQLRDYGESDQLGLEDTPEEFVDNLVKVFREVKRVLRDDGTVWLNLGDTWMGGGGGNYNKTGISQAGGQHLTNVRNRKDFIKKSGVKAKDLVGIPWRVALALQQDGWYLRQDIIWHKPNPMPESVKDRCTKAHEYIFLLSKSPKYYFDNEAIKEDSIYAPNKTHEKERAKGYYKGKWSNPEKGSRHDGSFKAIRDKKNKRSVWKVPTKGYKEAHFATYPTALIEPCVLAGCPIDGVVLDPFAGSGTTGIVAANHGRNAVLLELNKEYIDIAERRIKDEAGIFAKTEIE